MVIKHKKNTYTKYIHMMDIYKAERGHIQKGDIYKKGAYTKRGLMWRREDLREKKERDIQEEGMVSDRLIPPSCPKFFDDKSRHVTVISQLAP